jgi:3-dehydroquinate synthase
VAHALEQVTRYGIPHGEAVGLGLIAECALAERMGIAPAGLERRVAGLLERLGLPVRLTSPVAADRLVQAMASDKKNLRARVRFALPRAVGAMDTSAGWTREAPPSTISDALAAIV